jgi:hypothetical protein
MVACFQCREGDDSKNMLAIRLNPDHMNWMVDLAVYSFLSHLLGINDKVI